MLKKIYKYTVAIIVSLLVILSCSKDDDKIESYSTKIDASQSTLKGYIGTTSLDDGTNVHMLFSTDDGKTFVTYPKIEVGQSYKVKVVKHDDDGDADVTSSDYFVFDWSGSDPKPMGDASSEIAEFMMSSSNKISVKIASKTCTYDPSLWVGDWKGDEDGACCSGTDENTLRQDTDNANMIIMDNFWGDGVDAYMIFSPYTTYFDQIVTMPEQETSEGGIASGVGVYDQCRETFSLDVKYVLDGKTYEFNYAFHK